MKCVQRLGRLTLSILLGSALAAGQLYAGDAPEDRLIVLNKLDGTMAIIAVPSQKRLATIEVGEEPHEVAVTPAGDRAYVSNVRDRSLSVVDLVSRRVVRTLRPAQLDFPHGLAVTPDGLHLLLTSEGSHRLFLFDATRDVVLKVMTIQENGAHLIALRNDGERAFITNRDSGTVSRVKLPTLRVLGQIEVGAGPEGIAITPDGRRLLVALRDEDQVVIREVGERGGGSRLPTGRAPIRIAVTPDASTALVSNRDSGDVTILDLPGLSVKGTIRVGRRPGGIVIDRCGRRAYVCNNDSNTVSVISLFDHEVIDEIAVGHHPDGIAFVSSGGRCNES